MVGIATLLADATISWFDEKLFEARRIDLIFRCVAFEDRTMSLQLSLH